MLVVWAEAESGVLVARGQEAPEVLLVGKLYLNILIGVSP
jgi:hypothetical protein